MKKPISKKENPGLVKLAKKRPKLAEKFGYDANRITAANGGSMNHEQLTGFGAVRADVKSFGKK
jgi:hypothetical protein